MESKPDLVAVLEHYGAEYVPLRLGWASMLCPFHEDRTKSASVNTDKGLFKCFTCDVHGDAYDLIQHKEGIGFIESVEFGKSFLGAGNGQLRTARSTGKRIPGRAGTGRQSRKYIPPGRRGRTGDRT